MSMPRPRGSSGDLWQYHSRSDLHSKVACWAVTFDLLRHSRLLREHVEQGKVVFGINHEMRDFQTGRKKDLDLVIARPAEPVSQDARTLVDLADDYFVVLTSPQRDALIRLPTLYEAPVGAVLIALEAKAAMTEHSKARPRLYDELNSSHLTVHGASARALAVGLVIVNAATSFISPDRNKTPGASRVVTTHRQPDAARTVVEKVREIPRRSGNGVGYDGLGIVVVKCANDGTPVVLSSEPPAPQPGDIFYYDNMITRVANEYDARFWSI